MGNGIGATLLLVVILFPLISFILVFGELMVIRKEQKKIVKLLKRLDPQRGAGIYDERDDDAM